MTIRLTVADDHPIVLEGVARLFEREPDLEVVARCLDGENALEAVRRHRPDLLVLDVRMPGLSGLEVLRQATREGLGTRTVLLTAGATADELLEAVRLGARGVMFKDTAPELLVRCVRAVHAGARWLEPQLLDRALERWPAGDAAEQRPAKPLSKREAELATLVCRGMRNREVAARLGITEGTVKVHLYRIYGKLGVDSRAELVNLMGRTLLG